ncbi:protein phosphatase 1G isoform X2 [Callorhinchus milii]|uniref:protein phosphatase 1G isoform X2 n=1 Tax=Callorhinchus milii TaxID=7868 RepID=UPI0004574FCA|nr:protein phosphatase 1G isoform X2 [Callorhinchus milii]|eukprot:gi/632979940/ref/XP_007906751.1/ PREDICTED: protein phosphatase 1G isoform X2 [Callorhinchus milii]
MGAYLSQPNTVKNSSEQCTEQLSFGVSAMQGWRVSMEDAHNCIPELDSETSMFAVYDGHGGEEVALYCAKYLPEVIKAQQAYKNGKLQKALEEAFLAIDSKLTEEIVIKELAQIAGRPQEEDGEKVADEDDEAALLHEEATMTIEELLTRYGQNLNSEKLHAKCKPASALKKPLPKGTERNKTEKDVNGEVESAEASSHKPESKNGKSEEAAGISSSSDCGRADASAGGGGSSSIAESASGKEPAKHKSASEEAVVSSSTADAGPSCSSSAKSQRAAKSMFFEDSEDESEEAEEEEEEDSEEAGSGEEEYSTDGEEEEEEEEAEDEQEEDSDDAEEEDEIMLPGMDGKEEPGSDSGTTAVVALIRGKQLIVANAGDSRCVVSEHGKAIDMSYDHKPEDEVELARIKNAGGKVTLDGRVNGGLNLSRAIGDHFYKRNKTLPAEEQMISALPDLKVLSLNNDHEFMVIACDGIWNVMSSQEVVDFISERINKKDENGDLRSLPSISEELLDQCLAPDTSGDGTGCDNMTCIIITFKPRATKSRPDSHKRKQPDSTEETDNGKRTKTE